eukprot:scaffold269_cov229-Pinguiococcus_pyrenoidosus.AAC.4
MRGTSSIRLSPSTSRSPPDWTVGREAESAPPVLSSSPALRSTVAASNFSRCTCLPLTSSWHFVALEICSSSSGSLKASRNGLSLMSTRLMGLKPPNGSVFFGAISALYFSANLDTACAATLRADAASGAGGAGGAAGAAATAGAAPLARSFSRSAFARRAASSAADIAPAGRTRTSATETTPLVDAVPRVHKLTAAFRRRRGDAARRGDGAPGV